MTEQTTTTGVQELINRLSQEGVAQGQQQAEQLLQAAQQEANAILEAARRDADALLEKARIEAQSYQQAGEDALKLAARDAVRDFGARIHEGLRQRLQELVEHEIKDPQLIRTLILEVARQGTEDLGEAQLEALLPAEAVAEEDVRTQLEDGTPDALTEFVQGLVGQEVRDGFTVKLGSRTEHGITVRVIDEQVEIDLTDEAITELLAQHLLPRFRAIMRRS